MRKRRVRDSWSDERRAKVAQTWKKKLDEEFEAELLEGTGTKVRGKVCAYCGEIPDIKEPVPNTAVRLKLPKDHKVKFLQVPVCNECHKLLKYNESLTIGPRRGNIKISLLCIYYIFNSWTIIPKEKYADLNFHYRDLLDRMNSAKRRIDKRLAYKTNE